MNPLEKAILLLEDDLAAFNQGTSQQPKDNTTEWFLLRAKALGLSHLRRMQQLELHNDSAGAERFYRGCSSQFKKLTVPDPVAVEQEKLLDGTLPTGVV